MYMTEIKNEWIENENKMVVHLGGKYLQSIRYKFC